MFGDHLTGDFLATRAAATPDRATLQDIETEEEWRARELDAAAETAACTLDGATDEREGRVGLLLSTRPAYVVALYGAVRLGRTVVPLNVRLSTGELATRVDRVDPDVVVCEDETSGLLGDALAQAAAAPTVLSVDKSAPGVDGTVPDQAAGSAPSPEKRSPPTMEETTLVMFTSGTTGEPKGVRLTAGNLAASAVASAFRLGVTPGDRWLCCLPMYHMGGLAPAFRSALYGTELVIQREFDAAATASVLEDGGITGVSLVPTQLKRLLDATDDDLRAPGLRTVLLGGAPASESLLARAAEAGVPVHPTYGLTETASQVATARPATVREHPGTVGQPLFGTRVRVLPQDGPADSEPLGPGERGEVVVDGPTVTPGYLDEEQTAAAFGPHGLHTGDVGSRDGDGRLWIHGRVDDMILTGGELVAPATVLEHLRAVPGVTEAAVLGLDDEQWGEAVSALVVPEHDVDTADLRGRIRDNLQETLADYERPKTIAFAEELPRTQSGTVDRVAARERLRARRSRSDMM